RGVPLHHGRSARLRPIARRVGRAGPRRAPTRRERAARSSRDVAGRDRRPVDGRLGSGGRGRTGARALLGARPGEHGGQADHAARAYRQLRSPPVRACRSGLDNRPALTAVTGSPFGRYPKTTNAGILSRVKLLVPVIPPTFYAAGVNYREHVTEMAHRRGVKPEFPPAADVGYRANNALVATDEPIVIPKDATDQVQYEGELVVVIGKRCKKVSEAA